MLRGTLRQSPQTRRVAPAVLRVPDLDPVDPHRARQVDAIELQKHASAIPSGWHDEVRLVRANLVHSSRRARWIEGKRVPNVGVDGLAVSVQFPTQWHLNVAPRLRVKPSASTYSRQIVHATREAEGPFGR